MMALLYSNSVNARSQSLAVPNVFSETALRFNLPSDLLYAIALKESGTTIIHSKTKQKRFQAWPWTMNYNKKGYFFKTRLELYNAAQSLVNSGNRVVDVCPMQMNWRWHQKRFDDLWQATNPKDCIQEAANYLVEISKMNNRNGWMSIVGGYHNLNRNIGNNYANGVKRICKQYQLNCFS